MAAFAEKSKYRQESKESLDPTKSNEVWSSKIDGAHAVVQMEKGKLPRVFSHRISKRTGEPIEYTQKLPHIQAKSPITGVFRAEVYAEDSRGRAVHPDSITAMLNSGLEKSLELQKKLGIKTKTALIDVDSVGGSDLRSEPYREKQRWMNLVARRSPDFTRPDIATTPEQKEALVTKIWSGTHPQTKEGIVVHDIDRPGAPFTKVKKVDHHDVVVRSIFHEEATKPGRQPMAGGFEYSWTEDGPIMGRVGTGFNHAMKKDMMSNPEKYVGRVARVKALDLSKNRVLVKPSWDSWHVERNINLEKVAFMAGFEKRSALRQETQLQPHQRRVKERIGAGQSLLLYHGLGSGKTLSSIAATEKPGKKVDVVVPASLRPNYKKELQKFTHGKEGPDRNIQSYERATRKGLSGGDVLVADEIQRINNIAASRSQSVVGAAPSYKQRILLTGTPIKNAPSELAPIIRTLNPESKIPLSPEKFNEKFLEEKTVSPGFWNRLVHGAKPGIEVTPKNLPELRKAIHGHIDYHAPEKKGYPSTSEQVIKVPMSKEQSNVYATVTSKANPFIAWKVKHNMPLSKQESRHLNAFMTAARVVSNTTAPYGGKGRSPKFDKAVSDLDEHFKNNPRGKALVYSNYLEGGVKEYSKYLQEKKIPHHIFSGELSDKERKRVVEDYNSDKVKALLISGAGSEGLDLKGTRMVQVLEPHWNKQRTDQAIGRAVRFKSHEHLPPEEQHVHVVHYHSTHAPSFIERTFKTKPGTSSDEFLHSLSGKKEKINQAFLDVLKEEGERSAKEWQERK